MLVVIDMQNHILDPTSEFYLEDGETLVERVNTRLNQARAANEYVLFTRDIPIERKDEAESEDLKIIPALSPLSDEREIKKYYFTLPPEILTEIKHSLFERKEEQKTIEVVGIETNLCVLSNTIALQSAFPEADFIIDSSLVSSRNHEPQALKLIKDFNVYVKE